MTKEHKLGKENMGKLSAKEWAREIIDEVTTGYILGVVAHPRDEDELCLMMAEDSANRLVQKRLDKEISPMEMNDIRNELADIVCKLTMEK